MKTPLPYAPLSVATLVLSLLTGSALRANIVFSIHPEHCANADGYVTVVVNGGVPPYTYAWSDGPTDQNRYDLPAGSYTLTVTDFNGTQQQNIAVVPNLPNWEWDPLNMFAEAIPSCLPEPEPNNGGFIFFGNDYSPLLNGPSPFQFDQTCEEIPFFFNSVPSDWQWFAGVSGVVRAVCYFGLSVDTYAVNYTDANGCPGYMEAHVPQPPQFDPITVLDLAGSCSGGANGHVTFSVPPEPDYIFGARPHLFNPDGQENSTFWNTLATNWTNGWTYHVTGLGPGTYMLVRKLSIDPDFSMWFPCGDTTYITIPDLGNTCGHISGTVVLDDDQDCSLTTGDTRVPDLVLEFQPGPYYATTDVLGNYGIDLPQGNYTVTQQSALLQAHCLPDPIPLSVTGNATFNVLDTATQALDVQVSMASGPARPGFEMWYAIDLDNLTSGSAGPNQLVMTFDPTVSYLGATPSPTSVVGSTITWNNVGTLSYFGHRDVTVRFQVPPNVGLIGTVLDASASLTPLAQDANTANNSTTVPTTITGSYDPNEKVAATSTRQSDAVYLIDQDEWIDYTIRFQNTGTDTAFTIMFTDTLPSTLDAGSIAMGAGSHAFTWALQDAGVLKFWFAGILLPDSTTNEPRSHGFVSFRIRPRLPLLPGTMISNAASIFFDFNPPVITGASVLSAESSTGMTVMDAKPFSIFPDPVLDRLSIRTSPSAGTTIGWEIISEDGKVALQGRGPYPSSGVNVVGLPDGIYTLRLIMPRGPMFARFIKLH